MSQLEKYKFASPTRGQKPRANLSKYKLVLPLEGWHHAFYTDDEIVAVDVSTGNIVTVVPIPSPEDIRDFKRKQRVGARST